MCLAVAAVTGCGRDDSSTPAETTVTGKQALDVYEASGQRLEVSAELPIGGKTVFHYRFTGTDQQAELELSSDNTQQIKPWFSALSPQLREQMKGLVAERIAAPRQSELLGFYQIQQGVLEASEGDKVLYCSDAYWCYTTTCCSGQWGYGHVTCADRNCSGWWMFCSCSTKYYYQGCEISGRCG